MHRSICLHTTVLGSKLCLSCPHLLLPSPLPRLRLCTYTQSGVFALAPLVTGKTAWAQARDTCSMRTTQANCLVQPSLVSPNLSMVKSALSSLPAQVMSCGVFLELLSSCSRCRKMTMSRSEAWFLSICLVVSFGGCREDWIVFDLFCKPKEGTQSRPLRYHDQTLARPDPRKMAAE